MGREVRYAIGSEIRAEKRDDGKNIISGYAAVFERDSVDFGGWVERIAKGAFRESVQKRDVRALWSHNLDLVLGRTSNRTLRIFEDDYGLGFELELPDTTLGRDAFTSISRGDVTGMSFGFDVKPKDQKWTRGEEGQPYVRTLLNVELYEVSPTAFPAYEATNVAVRDTEGFKDAAVMLEEFKRSLNTESQNEARLAEAEAWRPRL